MQERTSLEDALTGIGKVERELEDNVGMIELGEAENDSGVVAEAEAALKALKKEIARRMITMVGEINAKFPDGKMHVSCYTCHRGETEPKMAPPPPPAQ